MNKTLGKWTTRRDGKTFGIYRNGELVEGGFFYGDLAHDALVVYRNDEADALDAQEAHAEVLGDVAALHILLGN